MSVEVGGVEVELIGVQVTVENIAGSGGQMENVFGARIPKADFLLHDTDHRAAVMINGAPHGRVQFLLDALLFRKFLGCCPVE